MLQTLFGRGKRPHFIPGNSQVAFETDEEVVTVLAESPQTWATPLRNIQFSMINTLQSPQAYSILAGSDINGDGLPFNDRVGDIGRNTYLGAAYYDTDLRLQRLFPSAKV
ncbi:hypothetical protein GOB94_03530 [Granulicella sp. 5B5]|uniref:hypothetical protein n=1 Tax=Granulicella sp. 5B5 TaxID=1617967 RepID=UPI0015F36156|nr:hypothetical protein [Granulicella sp. 5B5]QMV17867.1 hypothetical protein GOB94_03530 [Granulicella sp. 5B5]